MNLGKIVRAQLIALWALGLIVLFLSIVVAEYDDAPGCAAIGLLILGGLSVHTFYLWRGK